MSKKPVSDLIQAAKAVRNYAYAPYSGLMVGAAVECEHGHIHVGCNVENAAYPEGLCAEANAISTLIANSGSHIRQICIISNHKLPIPPCGGCLQKIREFAESATPVIICGADEKPIHYTLGDLLPHAFTPELLETKHER
ncbi:MAG TPA: cytidine deaminase [Hellea balneolensis]|uniref:Cytidine deaminase n=1 Tax=Hellea balneolensis TaxID=287478 RepID=A0A7C5R1A5_9PROT|nr:cytidine deaminase [Hellea balneolensis]